MGGRGAIATTVRCIEAIGRHFRRCRRLSACCQPSTRTEGSREEPWSALGLQRLLADIDAGLAEQVVIYKVDRLTRCLADFAKLVERLEMLGPTAQICSQNSQDP